MESVSITLSTDDPSSIACDVFVRQVDNKYQQDDELFNKYGSDVQKVGNTAFSNLQIRNRSGRPSTIHPISGEVRHLRKMSMDGLPMKAKIRRAMILARTPTLIPTTYSKVKSTMRNGFEKYYRAIFANIEKEESRVLFPVLNYDGCPLSACALFIDNVLMFIQKHGSSRSASIHELIVPCDEQRKHILLFMLGHVEAINKTNAVIYRARFENAASQIHSGVRAGMTTQQIIECISESRSISDAKPEKRTFCPFRWSTTEDSEGLSSDVSQEGSFKKPLVKRRKSIDIVDSPPLTPNTSALLPQQFDASVHVQCDCKKNEEELAFREQELSSEKARLEVLRDHLEAHKRVLEQREKKLMEDLERLAAEEAKLGDIKEAKKEAKMAKEELKKVTNKLETATAKRNTYRIQKRNTFLQLQRRQIPKGNVRPRMTAEQDFAFCTALNMGRKARLRAKKTLRKIDTNLDIFCTAKESDELWKQMECSDDYEDETIEVKKTRTPARVGGPQVVDVYRHKDVLSGVVKRLKYLVVDKQVSVPVVNGMASVRIALSGDKGGALTKIGVAVLDIPTAQTPDNFFILAQMTAGDDYETLRQCLPFSFWQGVESIHGHEETFHLPRGPVVFTLSLVVCSDLKFVYTLLGHGGATTARYCPICPVDKIKTIRDWHPFRVPRLPRDKATKDDVLSIRREPLLHLSGNQIILPGLHIVLGLVTKGHNLLKALLRAQISWKGLEASGSDDALEEIESQNLGLKIVQLQRKSIDEAIKVRRKMARIAKRKKEAPCAAKNCLLSANTRAVFPSELHPWSFLDCTECTARFHRVCDSVHSIDTEEEANEEYKCSRCQGMKSDEGFYQLEEKMATEFELQEAELKEKLEELKKEHADLLSTQQQTDSAEYEKALQDLHKLEKDIGISSRTWYSSFIGRDIRRLADHAADLWSGKQKAGIDLFKNILTLRNLFNDSATPAVEQAEIFKDLAHKIRDAFLCLNPEETVTVKCHLLEHGPAYLEQKGRFADFQDGLIETIHQIYNGYERRFSSILCMKTKMEYMVRLQNSNSLVTL